MKSPGIRILLAEGRPDEAAKALRLLFLESSGRCEITSVSSVATLVPSIQVTQPDLIFLDLRLTRPDPLDTVRRVHGAAPAIPLILVADPADKDFAARALAEGAQDYLLKGFMDTQTLDRVLRAALDRTSLEASAEVLHDPITGLYNRRGFEALAARSLQSVQRAGGTLVVLWSVFENLPAIQKEFGEHERDRALREAAEAISGSFRRTDLVARVADSEFAVLAMDAAEPSAPVLRQRVESRLAVRNQAPGRRYPLALRIGVWFWSPKAKETFEELIHAVEEELHGAKPV